MQMMVIKCLFLLLTLSRIEGSEMLRELDYSSVNQRTMKIILESCYENDSLFAPIVVFGDFNEFIDGVSIIRINSFLNVDGNYEKRQLLNSGASKIILIGDSPHKLASELGLLEQTRWWNPMIPHFIVDNSNRPCKNLEHFLVVSWYGNIINTVYICAESPNQSVLWTVNRMANFAPHPWQLKKTMRKTPSYPTTYIFGQVFDANISCENLNYDKTKFLTEHEVTGVAHMPYDISLISPKDYCSFYDSNEYFETKLLKSVFQALNVKRRCELEKSKQAVVIHFMKRTADMMFESSTLQSLPGLSSLFPHGRVEMIAVVKLNSEVSTLQKIFKIWSIQVLILAGIALALLLLILILKNHDFSLAILDLVRLLTYTSILTNNRGHPFRIYFTTMLIFMVISNGVFQGLIAAFLTTEERISAVETLEELVKLEYKMYTQPGGLETAKAYCPKCNFKQTDINNCIQYLLYRTKHVCVMSKFYYEKYFILSPLDNVKKVYDAGFISFKCSNDWPLKNRVNRMIMAAVEAGLVDHWEMEDTYHPKMKRQAMEDEWSSAQYKPVRLYKLKFAFQLLAIGLSLSTIVFFLELLVAKYATPV